MKFRRIIGIGLALLTATSLLSFTASAATDASFNFYENTSKGNAVYDSLLDTTSATVVKKDTSLSGYPATLITPVAGNTSDEPISIKHDSLANEGIELSGKRYVVYAYYYRGVRTDLRPTLTLHQSDFNMTATVTAQAMDTLSTGWRGSAGNFRYIAFDIGDYMGGYYFQDGTVPKMTFNPYGDIPAKELTDRDKIYINKIMFWTESTGSSNLTLKYPAIFTSGRQDAEGTDPETQFVTVGSTVTMPENPYTLKGYKFNGWICSDGNVIYNPGDKVTITQKVRLYNGNYFRNTGRTYFVADWVLDDVGQLSDVKSVKFYKYSTGTRGIANAENGQYMESCINGIKFDKVLSTSKFVLMTEGSSTYNTYEALEVENKNKVVTLSSDNWHELPLDIEHYKHCAILYYWGTDSESDFTPVLSFQGTAEDGKESALTADSVDVLGQSALSKNQWSVMEFSFDFLNDSRLKTLTNFDKNTVIKQLYLKPFGYKGIENFYGDKLYIADVVFFSEKPSDVYFCNGFVEGYTDGTFKPNSPLTRAEAAAIIARMMGYIDGSTSASGTSYTDVPNNTDTWYYDEVCFLEEKGVLKPSEDNNLFGGSENCDRIDYVTLLINAATGINGASTVGETAFGTSISGSLTRAEAVIYANSILKGANYSNSDIDFSDDTDFLDIDKKQWYSPDVVLCSNDLMLYRDAAGEGSICSYPSRGLTDVTEKTFRATQKYIDDLDETTAARVQEIRNTASDYQVKTGRTVYYVSSSAGSSSNAGTSASSPKKIASLNAVSNLSLGAGDVVLFKRGDVFTGTLTAVSGVTYSAYGSGAKPMFVNTPVATDGTSAAGDPDNWTLDYSYTDDDGNTVKIWKYADTGLRDVGAINLFNSGSAFTTLDPDITVAYKVTPNFNSSTKIFVKADGTTAFDYKTGLTHDLMFFHNLSASSSTGYPDAATSTGPLYLRCDAGNPANVFSDITFNGEGHVIVARNLQSLVIDNICIKYFGSHGLNTLSPSNYIVRNCEIGWGGGSLHGMSQSSTNVYTFGRFGNGVEYFGSVNNCYVDNCYVYEIYDAGITHQISASTSNVIMEDVYYTNNVLVNSTYNIEYFMSDPSDGNVHTRMMKDIYITGNIMRGAGYGWGAQRPKNTPANILSWTHANFGTDFVVEDNIIDRTVNLTNAGATSSYLVEIYSKFAGSAPYMKDNILVQAPGRHLMRQGNKAGLITMNHESEELFNLRTGDGNKLYFSRDDKADNMYKIFWK